MAWVSGLNLINEAILEPNTVKGYEQLLKQVDVIESLELPVGCQLFLLAKEQLVAFGVLLGTPTFFYIAGAQWVVHGPQILIILYLEQSVEYLRHHSLLYEAHDSKASFFELCNQDLNAFGELHSVG